MERATLRRFKSALAGEFRRPDKQQTKETSFEIEGRSHQHDRSLKQDTCFHRYGCRSARSDGPGKGADTDPAIAALSRKFQCRERMEFRTEADARFAERGFRANEEGPRKELAVPASAT